MKMNHLEIDTDDQRLIEEAAAVIKKNYRKPRHTVGAAVLCSSGKIYTGVNIESCGYGPCAEPVAIGTAISAGERQLVSIVAVFATEDSYLVLPPCGNCRQLLYDYAPDCMVIIPHNSKVIKVPARELLPDAYSNF
jgi:cytidine deaminase